MLDAYEIVKEKDLFNLLLTVPEFYIKDIHRREYNGKYFSISYSPADYEEVYNVSYLVAASLARLHALQPTPDWKTFASRLVRFGADQQQANGLWNYGSASHHQWADGFHTGYNLVSLHQYITLLNDEDQRPVLEKGFDCFIKTFTDTDGNVFYYSNSGGPLDAHNIAQAIITIIELGKWKDYHSLIYKIFRKSMKYLYDEGGYFYFQKHKYYTNKISYMRWSQAWMLLALTMLTYEWKK